MDETLDDFLSLCAQLSSAPDLVLATLIDTWEVRQPLGRRAWLLPDGQRLGTLTLGGCADSVLRRAAQQVRHSARAVRVKVDLGSGEAYEFGLTCSGSVEVHLQLASPAHPLWAKARDERLAGRVLRLVTRYGPDAGVTLLTDAGEREVLGQPLTPAQQARADLPLQGSGGHCAERTPDALYERWLPAIGLVVVGSGPIARPLTQLAHTMGLRVTVTDDRPERLQPQEWPGTQTVLSVCTGQELRLPPLGPQDAVVIHSHDYAHELSVLTRALASPSPYVALVASRRRGQALLKFMQDTGTDPAQLRRIHTPAGFDLGLESPAGIALSILSELAELMGRGKRGRPIQALDHQ
ncbi:XdhC/CoxI family protein [Deinococcus sp. HMF7620]|uniref:XdhC/CoxI family protein n=1 Tax=Deinococcus arboris TaxID=2682977 RepID=A0A7C9MAB3_9DEIO|nr:XdhC/CoxI family protein [Deinococcus arboris]MVN88263.1 XdhC/CoxI family protein [Deinococcus arboris]